MFLFPPNESTKLLQIADSMQLKLNEIKQAIECPGRLIEELIGSIRDTYTRGILRRYCDSGILIGASSLHPAEQNDTFSVGADQLIVKGQFVDRVGSFIRLLACPASLGFPALQQ
jgi:hypothetical protein